MKDYLNAVQAAGLGRTPQLCQDALIEALEDLFKGKKYNGQQGRKPLRIYKQDLPITEDNDSDVDTIPLNQNTLERYMIRPQCC